MQAVAEQSGFTLGGFKEEWYQAIRGYKKRLGRKLVAALCGEKQKQMGERVEHILEAEVKNPKVFFQKANPEKARRNDSIAAVRVATEDGSRTVMGNGVGAALREYWSKIYKRGPDFPEWQALPWLAERASEYRRKLNWTKNADILQRAFSAEELDEALLGAKDGKAAYDLPIECLKYADIKMKRELLRIMNEAYMQQNIPEEWS